MAIHAYRYVAFVWGSAAAHRRSAIDLPAAVEALRPKGAIFFGHAAGAADLRFLKTDL
jgi:hypothetical protein